MSRRSITAGLALLMAACTADPSGSAGSPPQAQAAGPAASSGVVSRVKVTCGASTLFPGEMTSCSATAYDASNAPVYVPFFSWGSSNAGVAQVSSLGWVTAVAAGSAHVSASAGGVSGIRSITVLAPPVATTLSITPPSPRVYVGGTAQLTGTVRDQYGNPMTAAVTWSSDHPAVATVSAGGLVTAVGPGTTTIRAASGSLSAAVPLVSAPTVTTSGPMYVEDDTATVTVTASPAGSYHYTWGYNTCQVSGSCPSGYTGLQAGQDLASGSRFVSQYATHVRFRIEVRMAAGGPVLETVYHYVDGKAVPLPPGQGGCGTGQAPTPIWC